MVVARDEPRDGGDIARRLVQLDQSRQQRAQQQRRPRAVAVVALVAHLERLGRHRAQVDRLAQPRQLPRTIRAPQVKKATPSSKVKIAHLLQIRHRDEVEPPVTEWLLEAYKLEDTLPARAAAAVSKRPAAKRVARPAATRAAAKKKPKAVKKERSPRQARRR